MKREAGFIIRSPSQETMKRVGGRDARPVAEAFARGAAEALTAEGRLLWFAGDAGEWGAWAAVALEVPIERLETLPLRARDAAPARVEVAERVEAARWRTSDAGEAASRLARTGATRAPAPSAETRRAIVRGLRLGAPVFAIGRPQNPAAVRRSRRR